MSEIRQQTAYGTTSLRTGVTGSMPLPLRDPRFRLDRAALLRHFDDDLDLLREIAETFLSHSPVLVQDVARAAAELHPARLRAAAHSLKGSAANFGAQSVVDAAYRLEAMGTNGQLDGGTVDAVCAELLARMQDLQADLTDIVQLNPLQPRLG